MASIVDPPPDGKTDLPGVQQISPEAALWLVRRSVILEYLNGQQPLDQRHNKRMAADLIRWVQEWCDRCLVDAPCRAAEPPADVEARESAARIDELRGWVWTLRVAAQSPAFRRASRRAYAQVADMLENAADLRESGDAR